MIDVNALARRAKRTGASLERARISVSCRVEGGVGEEEVPALVAPEGFEAEEGFGTRGAPKLSGPLEATLDLATRRLHRPTAEGFARPPGRPVVPPGLVFPEVGCFPGHRFGRRPGGQARQRFVQWPDHFHRRFVFELAPQRLEPGLERRLVFAPEGAAPGGQVLPGLLEVQPLAGLRPAVVGPAPNPHGPVADHQYARRLAPAAPPRLGVPLFAQGVQALAREHVAALDDDRSPAVSPR